MAEEQTRSSTQPLVDENLLPALARKGRGSVGNVLSQRFDAITRVAQDDGWGSALAVDEDAPLPKLVTTLTPDASRSIINFIESPDLPMDRTLNPYRGCEHGCVYCFARPNHAHFGLSPGLDFETKLFFKPQAAELLRRELARPGYQPDVLVIGVNTDAYQPIERELKITRSVLEVLAEARHPFTLITKSALVVRDLDLLAPLAKQRLVNVCVSLTTLDDDLHRIMEPRAARPGKRLEVIHELSKAGVPVAVLTSPLIPAINDSEMEALLEAASEAGAQTAAYSIVRLAYELKEIFGDWLRAHFPDRAEKVLHQLQSLHGGRLYDSRFGMRHKGQGAYADLLKQRFKVAVQRLGLNKRDDEVWGLETRLFKRPSADVRQGELF